jgi:gluconokinase
LPDPLVLAVDIGTGSTRATLFDAAGDLQFVARAPLQMSSPQLGWSEQDPDEVVRATVNVARKALARAAGSGIAAVSFSAQMYSIMAVARNGAPLTNSIPWTDTRAAVEAEEIRAEPGVSDLLAATGCPVQAIYPLSKIRWMRVNDALPDDAMFISIKDYVLWRLTGRLVTDWSTASGSGMLDLVSHTWSTTALSVAGLTVDNLPQLESPLTQLGSGDAGMLTDLGLPSGTPIVLGAGDAPLSSIGSGATTPDVLAINIGTSAAARQTITHPAIDPSGRLWTYFATEDRWVRGGIVGSAGSVYDWIIDLAVPDSGTTDDSYSRAGELAESTPPGADGLMFLPYFSGEQSPAWRPSSRGAFVGLNLHHERRHLVRAAIEGVVFALQRVRLAIEDMGDGTLREVSLTGGVTTSHVVRQIIADVLGLPVVVPPGHEGSARGAAILAWVALGAAESIDAFARDTLPDAPRLFPNEDAHTAYQSLYEDFVTIADRLGPSPNSKETTP